MLQRCLSWSAVCYRILNVAWSCDNAINHSHSCRCSTVVTTALSYKVNTRLDGLWVEESREMQHSASITLPLLRPDTLHATPRNHALDPAGAARRALSAALSAAVTPQHRLAKADGLLQGHSTAFSSTWTMHSTPPLLPTTMAGLAGAHLLLHALRATSQVSCAGCCDFSGLSLLLNLLCLLLPECVQC